MTKLLGALGEGSVVSLEIFFLTLLFALPLALPIALARLSKSWLVRGPVTVYSVVMRGTPLMLQLLFVYFGPSVLFDVSWDRFTAAVVAFTANYVAYFAEIYRGGILAIPKGQYEAAKVLGFTRRQTFFRIVLPQVVKRILPATANEVITLVKDTALAFTIGVTELFRVAQNASARQFSVAPIFVAGGFYLVMNWALSHGFARWERRLEYYH